jgi:hypothetical protein
VPTIIRQNGFDVMIFTNDCMAMRDSEFERQYAEATRRGERRLQHEPRAVAVCYDRRTRKVLIDLDNGCTLLVPPELAQGLTGASPTKLADVVVLGPGTAVSWPQLDVQFSVTGLLTGIFGTRAWMAELGRAGGRVKSAAKSRAARRNGTRGGRPRKTKIKGKVS